MDDNGDRPGRSRAGGTSEGSREIVASALLVGTTLAVLGAGALLRSGPERERAAPAVALSSPPAIAVEPPPSAAPAPPASPAPRPPEASPAASTAPRAAPGPPAPPAAASLARRAAADVARIGHARGRYTAQILVACRPDTVTRVIGKVAPGAPLYVLPVEVRGEACFRVCWGAYTTADEAARARDLPAALAGGEPARAVEIVKVLP